MPDAQWVILRRVYETSPNIFRRETTMKLRPFLTAALIALTAAPLVSSAQTAPGAAATQADMNALPPALRAALLSGNAAAIEQAINVLSAGNAARAGTLAGLVSRAASFIAATNPVAAAAGARASVAVANRPAVIAANPAASAQTAQQAMQIASSPAVIAAAPALAAQITASSNLIASNPTVVAAAPTLAAAVQATVQQVASNPVIVAAAPQLAQQIASQTLPQTEAAPIPFQQPPPPPSAPACGNSCAS